MNSWDKHFHDICVILAKNSKCLSRQIGCILVKNKRVVSTGYNGPPSGIVHCGTERLKNDKELLNKMWKQGINPREMRDFIATRCPRQLIGYSSGEGLEWCYAQHAEENCITNAAFLGVCTVGTTLYMNTVFPCQRCFGKLINAGIVEIVVDRVDFYDRRSEWLLHQTDIKVREFDI